MNHPQALHTRNKNSVSDFMNLCIVYFSPLFSRPEYVASNDWMKIYNELERMRKEFRCIFTEILYKLCKIGGFQGGEYEDGCFWVVAQCTVLDFHRRF